MKNILRAVVRHVHRHPLYLLPGLRLLITQVGLTFVPEIADTNPAIVTSLMREAVEREGS